MVAASTLMGKSQHFGSVIPYIDFYPWTSLIQDMQGQILFAEDFVRDALNWFSIIVQAEDSYMIM